jgi:hypothetical protein
MADVPVYKSKWQLQDNELFRIRFNLEEIEEKRITMSLEEYKGTDTVEHWVEFKMWDYSAMIALRKMATKYHKDSGSFYVDHDMYNDLKIRSLLMDWSFAQIDPHMKIQHHNNALTEDSFKMFRSLYPWVVNAIINKMNVVLEGIEA